ncbi:MAG TPA: nodulation protein NfeD [Thermomicrobiales bacterium]|nr:nodulation protein NfeD [Thermomicrobiales bacterium]
MRAFQRLAALTVLLLTIIVGATSTFVADSVSAQSEQPVVVATIHGTITPGIASYAADAIQRAERTNAPAVILQLDTPGGSPSAVDQIVSAVLESQVPVIAYIGPGDAQAISNSVLIVAASGAVVMSPAATIGNAGPIMAGTRSALRGSANRTAQAEDEDIASLTDLTSRTGRATDWIAAVVRDGQMLNANTALQKGAITAIAPDIDTLLTKLDGMSVTAAHGQVPLTLTGATQRTVDPSVWQRFMQYLANPTLAYLMVSFGILAIYFELAHPGLGVPSVLGTIMLIIGLLGLSGLPVSWIGMLFMAVAFVLFLIDIFVPSLGTLTILGLLSFLVGSNVLIARGAPKDLQIPSAAIQTMTLCLGLMAVLIGMLVVRAQFWKKKTGRDELIGRIGTATTGLNPHGMVQLFGELWTATSSAGPIEAGSWVAVDRVDGIRLVVRPSDTPQPEDSRIVGDRTTVIPVR